jgi:hypothetical protein
MLSPCEQTVKLLMIAVSLTARKPGETTITRHAPLT